MIHTDGARTISNDARYTNGTFTLPDPPNRAFTIAREPVGGYCTDDESNTPRTGERWIRLNREVAEATRYG